jgi:hypothetical protein
VNSQASSYCFDRRSRIALGLNHLQKLKEGERLDACTSPEDDFGADLAEYDARLQMRT